MCSHPLLDRLMTHLRSLSVPRLLLTILLSHLLITRLLLRRLLPFIAQRLINRSVLTITNATITDPQKDRLVMCMKGRVENAGPLPAKIEFLGPVKLCVDDDRSLGAGKRRVVVEGGRRLVIIGEADGMPAISTSTSGSADIDAKVTVRILDTQAFAAFAKTMMESTKFSLTLLATDIKVVSFNLPIYSTKLLKTVTLKGLQNLNQIQILKAVTTGGTPTHITLSTTCEIYNLSDITLSVGTVTLALYHEDIYQVGTVEMNNLTLQPGTNRITATAAYSPQTTPATQSGRKLLASYVTNTPATVTIRGTQTSTPISYLRPALQSLSVTTILPPESRKMIEKTQLVIDPFRLTTRLQSATKLVLFNPMLAPVTILWMKGTVTCRGEVVGNLDEDLQSRNEMVVLAPETSVQTGIMGMRLRIAPGALGAILTAAIAEGRGDGQTQTPNQDGGIKLFEVDVESTIGCRVGQYEVVIDYRQEGVPVGLGG
ncbi:uncharacterized protein SPPG_01376 [Spizellomyces punctatus DAOM BR117]|uniref:Uncharacterized protein n=1 Tax=Spizellomyces punctatus (strain DAOM BR117) TaxID=645134 RepID=A0A0L0HS66_SPIPD|nr:uncharacterized protein SPPG_01376 [Spizellomyces punctatus DAOM BR117]KND03927.1 hypothetical protein SPPG_01376 [Spizellomyces punctatus DAOM BR117]|eukprot:XP_016611966.1 hypothetical protein SPPG_01376 [Spizellomyces punctatus DAOM BR117]